MQPVSANRACAALTTTAGGLPTGPVDMDTHIYAAIDLSNFCFTRRSVPFDWRVLHGLDPDALVWGT